MRRRPGPGPRSGATSFAALFVALAALVVTPYAMRSVPLAARASDAGVAHASDGLEAKTVRLDADAHDADVPSQPASRGEDSETARAIAASAYVIVDVKTGRAVREQRGEWLDTPVWPGSIAKLATFAAALDARTLTDRTRIVCTRRVTLPGGRVVDCSHSPLGHALSPVEAIAQSCNVFAASIARTLTRAQLSHGFVQMGLAPLPSGADLVASALGLDGAKVAPRRLIEPVLRGAAPHQLLWEGLRASARTGTSSAFERAGIDALAKTGTAPMRSGRALGLVAAATPSESPRYAIVVALPGGSGAQAAETAAAILRPFLTEHAGVASSSAPSLDASRRDSNDARERRDHYRSPVAAGGWRPGRFAAAYPGAAAMFAGVQRDDASGATIRVGRARAAGTRSGYEVESLTLEEYVAQVVAGETSSATPAAAREALAITARTYAVVNRGRHAADGFDVCSLTHCQVTRPATAESRAAAERTRGRLLVREGRPVPVFYSASCGGTLVDPRALLPEIDPATMPWLASRPDPAGVDEKTWQTDIPARDLLSALQRSGYRGDALRSLTAHTAANGLVTDIKIDGLVPSTLTADDFRRAIGQQLGWHLLKSLRFSIQRTAAGYSFTGRGHGHGVGLCVLGASALAARGADASRILETYFPGLQRGRLVGFATSSTARDATDADARSRDVSASTPATRGTPPASVAPLTRITLRLPEADERERGRLLRLIDTDVRELTTTLSVTPPESLAVVVHPTGDSYRRATRSPWWTSGTTVIETNQRGETVTLHLAPLSALDRHAGLEQTLRHELVHVLTVGALANRPRWVHEGLAIHLAGERVSVAPASASAAPSRADSSRDANCPSDRELRRASTRAAFDHAYTRAAACVARELDAGRSWRDLGAR